MYSKVVNLKSSGTLFVSKVQEALGFLKLVMEQTLV